MQSLINSEIKLLHRCVEIDDLRFQITDSMQVSFAFLNVAITQLRDAVEEVLKAGETFTQPGGEVRGTAEGDGLYEPCKAVTELTEHPGFPNVSSKSLFSEAGLALRDDSEDCT